MKSMEHIVLGSGNWEGNTNKAYRRLGWGEGTSGTTLRWVSHHRLP